MRPVNGTQHTASTPLLVVIIITGVLVPGIALEVERVLSLIFTTTLQCQHWNLYAQMIKQMERILLC